MDIEQVRSLNLDIEPVTNRTALIIESGLEWVQNNTTLEFDITNTEEILALPSCVRLFLIKFYELNSLDNAGVASESIEGLSQSFDTTDKNTLLWQFAEELLYPYLNNRVRFFSAQNRWNEQ